MVTFRIYLAHNYIAYPLSHQHIPATSAQQPAKSTSVSFIIRDDTVRCSVPGDTPAVADPVAGHMQMQSH